MSAPSRSNATASNAIDEINERGTTSLYEACRKGEYDNAKKLLESGADPLLVCGDYITSHGNLLTPYYAATKRSDEIRKLIDKDYLLDATKRRFFEISNIADGDWINHKKEVDAFLQRDPDFLIYATGEGGRSALHNACRLNNKGLVEMLLEAGANPFLKDDNGLTPYELALQNNDDIAKFIEKDDLVDQESIKEVKDLHEKREAEKEKKDALIAMAQKYNCVFVDKDNSTVDGALKRKEGKKKWVQKGSLISQVCAAGDTVDLQKLIDLKANLDREDDKFSTPIFQACANADEATLQMLLANGADATFVDENFKTALRILCSTSGNEDVKLRMAQTLLDHEIDPTISNNKGDTAAKDARSAGLNKLADLIDGKNHEIRNARLVQINKLANDPGVREKFDGYTATKMTSEELVSLKDFFRSAKGDVRSLLANVCETAVIHNSSSKKDLRDRTANLRKYCESNPRYAAQIDLSSLEGDEISLEALARQEGRLKALLTKDLIASGANVLERHDAPNMGGSTFLTKACVLGNFAVAEVLLDEVKLKAVTQERVARENLNYKDSLGESAMHYCAAYNNEASARVVRNMLDVKGVEIDIQDNSRNTPILTAINQNNLRVAEVLLDKKANIRTLFGKSLNSIMHWTCVGGFMNMSYMLADKGAECGNLAINIPTQPQILYRNADNKIPLQLLAPEERNKPLIKLMIKRGVGFDQIPLEKENASLLKLMVDCGAGVDYRDKDGKSLLSFAAETEDRSLLRALLVRNAATDLNKLRTDESFAPDIRDSLQEHYERRRDRLKLKMSSLIDEETEEGLKKATELREIAAGYGIEFPYGRISVDSTVSEEGEDKGNSLLCVAAARGDVETITKLIAAGANIEHQNNGGYTPFLCACIVANYEAIEELEKHGARVTAEGDFGHTALHILTSFPRDMNQRDKSEEKESVLKIARFLIDRGVDSSKEDGIYHRADQYIEDGDYEELSSLLLNDLQAVNKKTSKHIDLLINQLEIDQYLGYDGSVVTRDEAIERACSLTGRKKEEMMAGDDQELSLGHLLIMFCSFNSELRDLNSKFEVDQKSLLERWQEEERLRIEIVKNLLANGANPAATVGDNGESYNCITAACTVSNFVVANILFDELVAQKGEKEAAASCSFLSREEGVNVLHHCAYYDNKMSNKLAEKVLNLGSEIDIDQTDASGNTALACAILQDNEFMVRLLMQRGANINLAKDGDVMLEDKASEEMKKVITEERLGAEMRLKQQQEISGGELMPEVPNSTITPPKPPEVGVNFDVSTLKKNQNSKTSGVGCC